MGKLTAEQKVCEYNRGQKAAREGRSRSWSEPWAYPFESDQHTQPRLKTSKSHRSEGAR
jgi:hypothetical protein